MLVKLSTKSFDYDYYFNSGIDPTEHTVRIGRYVMLKKRTSAADTNEDEKANKGSDSVFPQHVKIKQAKFDTVRDTMLQDLPNEILECILVKAVALEVIDSKLVKSAWKEKADLLISQLATVCWRWNCILTTDIFLEQVHRILDGFAQKTFRLEILYQLPIHLEICSTKLLIEILATMKDEMFVLRKPKLQDFAIDVYDRNNMEMVTDVIPLPGIRPVDIGACTVSNCLYVLNEEPTCHSVLRIMRDEEHQFTVSPWISDLMLSDNRPTVSVSTNGNLIILSRPQVHTPAVVRIYNAKSSLQHEVTLSSALQGVSLVYGVIQKSDGNLVVASNVDSDVRIDLTEIDTSGRIVRQYKSLFRSCSALGIAGSHDRIVLANGWNRFELLDCEFNLIQFADSLQLFEKKSMYPCKLHYNSDRNEIARICPFLACQTRVLTIFRFKEE